MGYGRYVEQLNRNELDELKQRYVSETVNNLSYGELADSTCIPDGVIFEYYGGISFVEDDFFCNQDSAKQ